MEVAMSANPMSANRISIALWVAFMGAGIAAVWLLDFETFIPVFAMWCFIGILLANKAERSEKSRTARREKQRGHHYADRFDAPFRSMQDR